MLTTQSRLIPIRVFRKTAEKGLGRMGLLLSTEGPYSGLCLE